MMIVATWMVHCLVIAAVLAAAAGAWELSARWSGRPARWAWLAALAGSVVLPWLLRLLPEQSALPALPMAVPVFGLDPLVVGGSDSAGWSAVDAALAGWALLSVAALGYVVLALFRLGRARRGWRQVEVDGQRVYVTRDTGPAALGVRGAAVIVPAWALQLDAELRGLLLQHEREHVTARDPALLIAALTLVAAMPWNPVLWFQLLRLRHAVELDCDGRVLRRGADPERYGSLLLEVGRRRAGGALVMATFAEPRVFLRERIRRIATWPLERRRSRAWLFSALALVLCATALNARDPLRPRAVPPAVAPTAGEPASAERPILAMPSDTPVFTPMTVAPELLNRDDVARALSENYPPLLRDAGVGGHPAVWFFIDEEGIVRKTLLSRSSGHAQLDEAALNVAGTMRFSPALNRERRVAVWVELPIIFTARHAGAAAAGRRSAGGPHAAVAPVHADDQTA